MYSRLCRSRFQRDHSQGNQVSITEHSIPWPWSGKRPRGIGLELHCRARPMSFHYYKLIPPPFVNCLGTEHLQQTRDPAYIQAWKSWQNSETSYFMLQFESTILSIVEEIYNLYPIATKVVNRPFFLELYLYLPMK